MFYDLALIFDPNSFSCDLALTSNGDLAIDETPVTPMLLSVGLDRRANNDDPLPQSRDITLKAAGFDAKRGTPLDCLVDCLDQNFARIGSKCWLLDRAKESEETRLLYKMWLEEALEWSFAETGRRANVEVSWARPQLLKWRIEIDDYSLVSTASLSNFGSSN